MPDSFKQHSHIYKPVRLFSIKHTILWGSFTLFIFFTLVLFCYFICDVFLSTFIQNNLNQYFTNVTKKESFICYLLVFVSYFVAFDDTFSNIQKVNYFAKKNLMKNDKKIILNSMLVFFISTILFNVVSLVFFNFYRT